MIVVGTIDRVRVCVTAVMLVLVATATLVEVDVDRMVLVERTVLVEYTCTVLVCVRDIITVLTRVRVVQEVKVASTIDTDVALAKTVEVAVGLHADGKGAVVLFHPADPFIPHSAVVIGIMLVFVTHIVFVAVSVSVKVISMMDAQAGDGSGPEAFDTFEQRPRAGWHPTPQYASPTPQKPCSEQHVPQMEPWNVTFPPHAPSSSTICRRPILVPESSHAAPHANSPSASTA